MTFSVPQSRNNIGRASDKASFWSLRTRLAFALIAAFIPIAALIVYFSLTDADAVRQERLGDYETIGTSLAGTMDGFARDLESVSTAAAGPIGESGATISQETMGPYLKYLSDSIGTLRAVFMTDAEGRVVASDTGTGNGTDLASRDYIKQLMAGETSVWSGALSGLQSGQTTVAYARAILGSDGRPRGFFVFAFYPEDLAQRYAFKLPEDATVSVFDTEGKLLFSVPNNQTIPATELQAWSRFQEAREGESVILTADITPLSQDERYGALVPVGDRGWVLAFTQPQSVIDAPLNVRLQRNLALAFVVLAVAFLVTHTITSRLLRPLGRLANEARAMERGETPNFQVSGAESEIRTLQQSLQSMAAAVSDRESRLQNTAGILETVEQVGEALAKELDVDKVAHDIADAALRLTTAQAAAIYEVNEAGAAVLLAEAGDKGLSKDLPPALLSATLSGEVAQTHALNAQAGVPATNGNGHLPERLIVGIPFVTRQGAPIGGLFIINEAPRVFTEYQEGLARGLARRATVVIENAHLYTASQAMQETLREANASKDEFLGIIAHELRTPVTTILGGARLLRSRRSRLPEHAQEEMIVSMEEESERLYRLVEDLLIIARTELGLESLLEPTSLAPILSRVSEQFAVRYPKRELETHIEPELPPVAAEQTYVQQVVSNFLSNAYKYSDPNFPVEVSARVVGEQVEVRVKDRGPGVEESELPRIFERFYRSERTSGRASGKGLGLTACKRLVEAMGGEIFASRREGGGLEIGFRLAIVDDAYAGLAQEEDVLSDPVEA